MTCISWLPMCHGRLSASQDALGDLFGLDRRHVVADDDELVAAEPRHRVAGPDRVGDPFGRVPQQLVAGAVAQRVVDQLELIDVEEHHAELRAASTRAGEAVDQPVRRAAPGWAARSASRGEPDGRAPAPSACGR